MLPKLTTLLTADKLLQDKMATDLGVWFHKERVHGQLLKFTIMRVNPNKYVTAVTQADHIHIIGEAPTLEGIVANYNNFVSAAQTHDLTAVLDQTSQEARIVVGR